MYYITGQGVPQSTAIAVKWWRKVAEQGHKNAIWNLEIGRANGDCDYLSFIFSRLTTNRINPLIFSCNADCQWVNCSQNETKEPLGVTNLNIHREAMGILPTLQCFCIVLILTYMLTGSFFLEKRMCFCLVY